MCGTVVLGLDVADSNDKWIVVLLSGVLYVEHCPVDAVGAHTTSRFRPLATEISRACDDADDTIDLSLGRRDVGTSGGKTSAASPTSSTSIGPESILS